MRRSACALFHHSMFVVLGGLLVLAGFAGCDSGSEGRQPVTGTIKFKGAPLTHGRIEFSPQEKSAGTMEGAEVRDGKYSLPVKSGLMPGKYQVRISAVDESQKAQPAEEAPGAGPAPKELIPEQYNVNSKLTAEVTKKGPNNFDFNLE